MKREELPELHYIAPISNVLSIIVHGILSHNRAEKVEHQSVAMQAIQDRRASVVVPGGKRLHDYVNLYIHARNPMMYVRKGHHMNVCVLRISTDVLDLPGVVVADRNAATDYVRFAPAPGGLDLVDATLAFARYWPDPDPIRNSRQKSARCAEILVPDRVDPHFIHGTYVSCPQSHDILAAAVADAIIKLDTVVNADLFFQ